MHVAVHIVTWSSLKTIGEALASLRGQTYRNMSILIVDNGSTDGTLEFIKKEFPEAHLLRNFKNLGFARAHNQAIEFTEHRAATRGDDETVVLVMNPDVVIEETCVEELVSTLARHKEAAGVGAKLLRLKREENPDSGFRDSIKTDIVDSVGLKIWKSRRVTDRGSGERDCGQYESEEEVFGISGALVLYRLRALHAVSGQQGFFDNNFFAYKEDVDISWRLRRAGFSFWYAPKAIAYHIRGVGGTEQAGIIKVMKARSSRSSFVREFSARNHWLTIFKNDSPVNVFLHLPYILPYELGKLGYYLLREPKTFFASLSSLKYAPKILWQRMCGRGPGRVEAEEIRKWFV